MTRALAVTDTFLRALVLASLCACAPQAEVKAPPKAPSADAAAVGERAYGRPPAALGAVVVGGGRVRLAGSADPGARVRLASPAGRELFVRADRDGRWTAVLPDPAAPRLFGLSMQADDRMVQSDGYLALAPGGELVRLRSGAGALVLGPPGRLAITALDYDRKGGAVISGRAAPGAQVSLWVDGVARGTVGADGDGRFFLDLDEPLAAGRHGLLAKAAAQTSGVEVALDAPAALTGGPVATERAGEGWRIVWLTPGGGLQTTVIFGSQQAVG